LSQTTPFSTTPSTLSSATSISRCFVSFAAPHPTEGHAPPRREQHAVGLSASPMEPFRLLSVTVCSGGLKETASSLTPFRIPSTRRSSPPTRGQPYDRTDHEVRWQCDHVTKIGRLQSGRMYDLNSAGNTFSSALPPLANPNSPSARRDPTVKQGRKQPDCRCRISPDRFSGGCSFPTGLVSPHPLYQCLVLKASYWRWPDRGMADNAIDFYTKVLGTSFNDAMKELTEG
jgi:hypothetical protein